jgi:hypothetical protein
MQETSLKVEELIRKLETKVLSIPCPHCGGREDTVPAPGDIVRCKFCKEKYTVQKSLDKTSAKSIQTLVAEVLEESTNKMHNIQNGNLDTITRQLEDFARQIIGETKDFYKVYDRLPSIDEIANRLDAQTQRLFNSIALSSKEILSKQNDITVSMKSALGRIDSVEIKINSIKELLEATKKGTDAAQSNLSAKSLIYVDFHGNEQSIPLHEVTISRNKHNFCLEGISPDGKVEELGLFDPTVSSPHAKFCGCNNTLTVTDLGSTNGTFVNGHQLKPLVRFDLRLTDIIQLGLNTQFSIREP